ncbi:hypothetical protein [Streptomyces sp. NBC_00038]|uniref:hypothetical protein n=1 Tax=Streptomyces sp. NBC_00038 TaxID=2903615 RepID=UPI00225115DB|nr:hypothetical protein [Streptomyces sp. NBC_00038]MCX5554674.1 hypothetical protein [Streptomyces sp. NBC_00038]
MLLPDDDADGCAVGEPSAFAGLEMVGEATTAEQVLLQGLPPAVRRRFPVAESSGTAVIAGRSDPPGSSDSPR